MVKRNIYNYAFKYISYCYKISYSIRYVYEASAVYYVSSIAWGMDIIYSSVYDQIHAEWGSHPAG